MLKWSLNERRARMCVPDNCSGTGWRMESEVHSSSESGFSTMNSNSTSLYESLPRALVPVAVYTLVHIHCSHSCSPTLLMRLLRACVRRFYAQGMERFFLSSSVSPTTFPSPVWTFHFSVAYLFSDHPPLVMSRHTEWILPLCPGSRYRGGIWVLCAAYLAVAPPLASVLPVLEWT